MIDLTESASQLLNVRKVAARLDVSVKTIYRLIYDGSIRHRKIRSAIRVSEADLEAFIQSSAVAVSSPREDRISIPPPRPLSYYLEACRP